LFGDFSIADRVKTLLTKALRRQQNQRIKSFNGETGSGITQRL